MLRLSSTATQVIRTVWMAYRPNQCWRSWRGLRGLAAQADDRLKHDDRGDPAAEHRRRRHSLNALRPKPSQPFGPAVPVPCFYSLLRRGAGSAARQTVYFCDRQSLSLPTFALLSAKWMRSYVVQIATSLFNKLRGTASIPHFSATTAAGLMTAG
jgi:hypothetical protein